MPVRFDSRPLVLRRAYTATMRATSALHVRDQVNHGLHLFFIIAASVISRNVASQQVLDAPPPAGPDSLGTLYMGVAVVAGVVLAAVGWLGRSYDARSVASVSHLFAAITMGASFVAPSGDPYFAIAKYVVMDINMALLLLVFGLMLGARMGPREARRVAARVGVGGILGGLVGGLALSLGARFVGSRELFLLAAGLAVAPVFWLPATHFKPAGTHGAPARDRADVPQLGSYGGWVMVTTLLMVATTTLVDYVYRRHATDIGLSEDRLTSFFGVVILLAGVTTIIFQVTALDRMLDKVGLFATAMIMPGAIIGTTALFGLSPGIVTLVILKLVDSGTNMSVQQATGGLLLAPLGVRARSVWQGRIDGLAKRGGQLLMGGFLAALHWPPLRILPVLLFLCALWVLCILITRSRYIKLLTAMLGRPPAIQPELQAYDGTTMRLLERELARADPARAAVILDLMEQAEHRAPEPLLRRLADADDDGRGAILVIDHLSAFGDTQALLGFSRSPNPTVAGEALLALDEVDPAVADQAAKQIIHKKTIPDELRALSAGLLAAYNPDARALARKLAESGRDETRMAIAQSLARLEPGAPAEVGELLCLLSRDESAEIARTALGAVGRHLSADACAVALEALEQARLRGAGMRALAELGPPVVKPITQLLHQRINDPAVASALTWALARIGVATGVPPLIHALAANHTIVRLSAAVALNTLVRRRPGLELPQTQLAECYLPEITWYGHLRDASLSGLPKSPAGTVLRHSLRQRANASLETLFRLFSLRYPEESIAGAFAAIDSRDRARRQLALELLDNILESDVRRALADAVGEGPRKSGKIRDREELLRMLASSQDRFLAELSAIVITELDGNSATGSQLTTGSSMRGSLVDQILELQSVALFGQASAEDLSEVAQMVVDRPMPNNAVVFNEGEAGDAMYLIREGSVLLSRKGQAVERLSAGDAFGIVSVLDRLPREMTATTTANCSLMMIKAGDLHQLLADRPLLMHSIFRALTNSIRGQLDRVSLGKRTSD